jgi:pilus assembly protein Flp/PilA
MLGESVLHRNGMGSPSIGMLREEHSMVRKLWDFFRDEDGPTAVEYAVMLALIIVVCILAITALGTNANKVFSNVALNTAVTAS